MNDLTYLLLTLLFLALTFGFVRICEWLMEEDK
jgi:hypothetical protein